MEAGQTPQDSAWREGRGGPCKQKLTPINSTKFGDLIFEMTWNCQDSIGSKTVWRYSVGGRSGGNWFSMHRNTPSSSNLGGASFF